MGQKKNDDTQTQMEFVSIDELVPQDHLLRKIDKYIDFTFIREKVRHLYCSENGRPALDPVVLFKMLFIGYLFGIRSERQLIRDVQVNLAYKWFIGFGLRDKTPSHAIFSQNRRRRFNDSSIYQEIFDQIVWQAIENKMVSGKHLYTDSTHLKANANKNKFDKQLAEKSSRDYIQALEEDVNADRKAHGKKPLKKKPQKPVIKITKVSTTDPNSGYMFREGKPKGFFYLYHRTVAGKNNIITDTHVTAGNLHDSIPYLERLDFQRQKFTFDVDAVGLDAGYYTAAICKGLEERGINGVLAYSRPPRRKGFLPKSAYIYDEHFDCYLCPKDQPLKYKTTTRDGYREYVSNPKICKACELLDKCTHSSTHLKVVTRHVWQHHKKQIDENRYFEWGKKIYKRRKETVERRFADSKQLHGHRYARLRGISKVREQCLLAAVCQNMKKIALLLSRRANRSSNCPIFLFITAGIERLWLNRRHLGDECSKLQKANLLPVN